MITSTQNTSTLSPEFLASVNSKGTAAADNGSALTQDRFLKLLTTQLQNQDPLNPLDNAQMTSQMAQISTVNGIEKLNATLLALTASSTDGQVLQASSMLGREVLVSGKSLAITRDADGNVVGGVAGIDLAKPVDSLKVQINDANGLTIRTLDLGAQKSAGVHNFAWDGLTDSGAQAAAGAYTFVVEAEQGGEKVESTALQAALVTGVVRSSSGVGLELANLSGRLDSVAVADVRQIF